MNDLLKLLAAIATKQRGHRYIIDGMLHHEDWYIWFDVALDDDDPKPGTCDIHIQKCGTPISDAGNGFRMVKNANRHGVLRFLGAIGVSNLPEKARRAYYQFGVMNPLRVESQE